MGPVSKFQERVSPSSLKPQGRDRAVACLYGAGDSARYQRHCCRTDEGGRFGWFAARRVIAI